jgi:uncharacterized cupredoxin-like copper-binding protein
MHRYLSILAAGALASGAAHGHGNAAEGEDTAFGHPGDPPRVGRTVEIVMSDAMRFSPAALAVKKGETVRFVVRNRGQVAHEMVLGTDKDLHEHAAAMRRSPEMEHADANMVQVKPGGQAEMVWTFDKGGHFFFACLIPGHFEAGMKGKVDVK